MSFTTQTLSSTGTRQSSSSREQKLLSLLARRLAVEKHFAELGHTYRHGRFYRAFEHYATRPILKTGLKLAGLYERGVKNALSPVVRSLRVHFPGLPASLEGLQILHLSDFHIDGAEGLAEVLSGTLRDLQPDICLLTGDYRFEDRGPCEAVYPRMRKIIDSIDARHGIYGILGNHDSAEIALGMESLGVRMLVNEAAPITVGSDRLWIVGVDDPFDYRTHDLAGALAGVPPGEFSILLAHAPELYKEAAAAGVNLYLAGHTHAGQIRLPGIGAVRHNAECPRAYAFGQWNHESMQGYTTAGVGCSSLPIRFGCPPEIVLIELARQ